MENNFKNFFGVEARTKYFPHLLVYLFIAAVVVFALLLVGNNSLNQKQKAAARDRVNPFENLTLEAKSVTVWDVVNHRELFSKNSDAPLPLASLTKIMTAITAKGKLDENEFIKITVEDLAPEGDSKFLVGDIWRARDLMDFTLLTSSNDGAFALAAVAESKNPPDQFTNDMNKKAGEIGLVNSKFFNEHGLDRNVYTTQAADVAGTTSSGGPARLASESVAGGAYGSARDMAVLVEYALKNYPDVLEVTRYKNLDFRSASKEYHAENTNKFIDQIPNILASKTGYTDLAGGNLVVAFDAGLGRPIIITVLGSTEEGRFSDVLQLTEATLDFIRQ